MFLFLLILFLSLGEQEAYFKVKPAKNEGENVALKDNNEGEDNNPAQQVLPPDVDDDEVSDGAHSAGAWQVQQFLSLGFCVSEAQVRISTEVPKSILDLSNFFLFSFRSLYVP